MQIQNEKIDINPIREAVIGMNNLTNVDSDYKLYYDETNNIRRLHLTNEGLNVRSPQCFVLGGIAHRSAPPELDFEELRKVFQLQKSTLELKLEHLGKGDFPKLLNSWRIEALLDWLHSQDIFVHYQVLDPLYWSIVDVVDSIITEDGSVQLMMNAPLLKNTLYAILRTNVETTADLLGRYNYPEVGPAGRAAFLAELLGLLEAHSLLLPAFDHQMLKGLLQIAEKLETLPYLENEIPNVLIDCFGVFYLNRIALFKNATHVLDIEKEIETYLLGLDLRDGVEPLVNFSFIDSKTEPWVQVSDAIVGLLGKFFSFVNQTPIPELKEARAAFTDRQERSLKKLTHLLSRSIDECPAFAHYIVSSEDHARRASILGF